MEVLSGPWANLALLLRQTVTLSNSETDSLLPLWLFGLLLFLSVCLLLLQMIIILNWKFKQAEENLARFQQDRSAIHRQMDRSAHMKRRSFGFHSCT